MQLTAQQSKQSRKITSMIQHTYHYTSATTVSANDSSSALMRGVSIPYLSHNPSSDRDPFPIPRTLVSQLALLACYFQSMPLFAIGAETQGLLRKQCVRKNSKIAHFTPAADEVFLPECSLSLGLSPFVVIMLHLCVFFDAFSDTFPLLVAHKHHIIVSSYCYKASELYCCRVGPSTSRTLHRLPATITQATQLRLNDELDAGTHAVFSDVESYLRPRAVRPGSTNANDPRATDATAVGTAKGGVSRKGTASLRGPITSAAGASVSRAAQIISTSTHGGAQTAPEAKALLAGREDAAARSVGGRGAGRGGGEVALEGGGVWGGDLWFDRVEARGETGGRGLGARVGAGGVGGGTATSSPLFKVSERLRGAARASGERTRRKAAGVSQSPPSGNDESKVRGGGGGGRGGGGRIQCLHGGSRMTINPRIPTIPGRSTSGLHQPDRHCLHQARSAVRSSASRMKGELHVPKNRS